MASDRVVINLEDRARQVAKKPSPRSDMARSKDAVASAFLAPQRLKYTHIAPRCRWTEWSGERRIQEFPGSVFALIRKFVLRMVSGTKDERRTATAACVTGDATGARLGTAAAA